MEQEVSKIGQAMKKQAGPQVATSTTGLPKELSQLLQNMIAEALVGKFGQLKVDVGSSLGHQRAVRVLVFPDDIPQGLNEPKEEKKIITPEN